jgi:protein SCO1/2
MPARVRLVVAAVTLCAIAAVAGVMVADAGRGTAATSVVAIAPDSPFSGAQRPQGASAPHLAGLRDQDGKALDMAGLRGSPVVMTFVYSTCEDACPSLVQSIRIALERLKRDVPVIGVSVDPATDTPALARAFLLEQQMTGRMRFALGSRAALAPVWRAYGIAPQRDGREHSAAVVLVDERGMQRVGWPHDQLTPEGLAHDLRALL